MYKNLFFAFLLLGLFFFIQSCSKDEDINTPTSDKNYVVKYEVKFVTPGIIKISYKTPEGVLESTGNVFTNWQKEYTFKNSIDSYLEVLIITAGTTGQTKVKLQIYVDGVEKQEFESSGVAGYKFSITYKSSGT